MDPARILYVEDEEIYQTLVRGILEAAGYMVVVAGSSRDAFRILQRFRPHLIILDINLPDTDGYTLCLRLRDEEEWATVPILMLTVRRQPEEWRQGFSAGANDYVSKPLHGPDLVERVRSCLAGKSARPRTSHNPEVLMVKASLAGNRGAFDVFVRQYKEELFKLMRRHSGSDHDAEELVAIAFTLAYGHLHQFRGDCPFFMWLYRIARRELAHKRGEYKPLSLEELTAHAESDGLDASEMIYEDNDGKESEILCKVLLARAMPKIPEEYRKPLELQINGMPYDKIARKLGVPMGTVMSRLSRGRDHLRKVWLSIRGSEA
jgi:RNA polymerase sigma factor (sigma-70 family)